MFARIAGMDDLRSVTDLAIKLWPDHAWVEMAEEMGRYIQGAESAAFLMEEEDQAVGLALCSLRHDYVEGTDSNPVGYLEGIFVEESFRGRGAARGLLLAAQQWAKDMGCRQFASDCELTNSESLSFHLACGFEEANRIICFVKSIGE